MSDNPEDVPVNTFRDLAAPVEAIDSLIYLARQSADDPARVKSYLEMAEEQMRQVRRAFGSNSKG